MTAAGAARHLQRRPELLAAVGESIEDEYARDTWDAWRLGVPARRGRNMARFGVIRQPWLREAIKAWSRFRLAAGYSFSTIDSGAQSLARFSLFLSEHPEVDGFDRLTRDLLERFLVWMPTQTQWGTNTRHHTLTFVKVLLDWGQRHATLPGLPSGAVLYEEEVSRPPDLLPRFIPEYIMNQLESEENLAKLPSHPTVRNLVVVLMETGMRGGDACVLPFNPIITDSVGWPCLRFENSKVSTEQLIPLSDKAATTIKAQQAYVLGRWPQGSRWLFPGIMENPEGTKPYAHASLSHQLGPWQKKIGLHDESGQPVRIHAHQFRHTLGTRLINSGVPQHVVQKLLGHASPRMTARYAALYDRTVREAFENYCRQRVNTGGEHLVYEPDALTADAEWVKHNLARIRDSLPNGYCGRPPQQDCPHPNACLTCPDFQTTPEFLDIHRKHAASNRRLLARAEADGQFRLADNLRRVQDSLERIIPALVAIQDGGE
ncbi:MAG TPA: tyrosine-type recombinase/integrase [Acidimicrobiales bacterium]|nr:tyrosine-type recombinase/integrase [Acidimicrobiales bacterium]